MTTGTKTSGKGAKPLPRDHRALLGSAGQPVWQHRDPWFPQRQGRHSPYPQTHKWEEDTCVRRWACHRLVESRIIMESRFCGGTFQRILLEMHPKLVAGEKRQCLQFASN